MAWQMAGRRPQRGPCRPFGARKGEEQQGAPVAPRPKQEDPRVKCKDCGAFGHKASSARCPMKHWDGTLALQPLGSTALKENLRPRTARGLRDPGPCPGAAGEKAQRARQEAPQRQALLQRFPRRSPVPRRHGWKELTEPCACVRHPNRPILVHTTRRRGVGDPDVARGSPVRKPVPPPTASAILRADRSAISPPGLSSGRGVPVPDGRQPARAPFARALAVRAPAERPDRQSHAPPRRPGPDSRPGVSAPGKRAAGSSTQTCWNPHKKPRLSPLRSAHKSTARPPTAAPAPGASAPPRAPGPTAAPGPGPDLRPPPQSPVLQTVHACHVPQLPAEPLRMVFTRSLRGQWSSRLLTVPAPPPSRSEGLCARVPAGALREDLQVSSSEEEGDGQ